MWKTSIIDARLAYKSFLGRFSTLINYTMWSSNFFFCIWLFPAFFIVQNFHSPDFSESSFFRVQVFLIPGFSGSRFFRVQFFQGPGFSGSESRGRIQSLGPCFRSSRLSLVFPIDFCYSQLIFVCILFKKDTKTNK